MRIVKRNNSQQILLGSDFQRGPYQTHTPLLNNMELQMRVRLSSAFSVTESCQLWAKTEDGRVLVSTVAPACPTPIILPPLLSFCLSLTRNPIPTPRTLYTLQGALSGRELDFVDIAIRVVLRVRTVAELLCQQTVLCYQMNRPVERTNGWRRGCVKSIVCESNVPLRLKTKRP